MKHSKLFYFTILTLTSVLASCKKDSGDEKRDQFKERFFIQSSEANYDMDLAQDNSNNFYITSSTKVRGAGFFFDMSPGLRLKANGDHDAYVAKFNENGKMIWATLLGGSHEEKGYTLAADAEGNVFVGGTFRGLTRIGDMSLELKRLNNSSGMPNMTDMFLASLDREGKVRWVKQISGTGFERPTSIMVSASGKVYVTGYFFHDIYFSDTRMGVNDQSGFFIACYDQTGTLDWGKVYGVIPGDYTTHGSIYPSNMQFAPNGDLLIAGSFEGQKKIGSFSLTNNGDQDVFLARFDEDGEVIWVRTFGGPSTENCPGLAVDKDGDIYIGGSFREQISIGSHSFTSAMQHGSSFLTRYNGNGSLIWASQVGLPGAQYIFDLVENDGKLHFTGYYDTAATIGDIKLSSTSNIQGFTAVYSASGLPESAENLGTISGEAKRIAIDKKGYKILAGTYYSPFSFGGNVYPAASGYDLFITKN
ncbi:SBBP repeat-containing protein [Desertivirga xinjiangensis]|uniref:SBBP repeat-containing protein n=1 Tax=Desertivirga xinjiangensis TaxID=539206 RepID=UPI00210E3C5D|nr:SBBP repeat-containing protein [Pedobacter xinjiangensis]